MEPVDSDEDISKLSKRPIVLSFRNASFSFEKPQNRADIDLNIGGVTDFSLESITFDVKKVLILFYNIIEQTTVSRRILPHLLIFNIG